MPKLQLALDLTDLDRALELAGRLAPLVDILEAGTPLIKSAGMAAVAALRARFPDREVLADMKTMDAGAEETALAATAGAHYTTVLGAAPDETIARAVAMGHRLGVRIVGDLLGVRDSQGRARELLALGVDLVQLHLGLDQQRAGDSLLGELGGAGGWAGMPLCLAGGLRPRTLRAVVRGGYPVEVYVVGAFLTAAEDPEANARAVRRALER